MMPLDEQEISAMVSLQQRRAKPWRMPFKSMATPALAALRKLPEQGKTGTPLRFIAARWSEIVGAKLSDLCFPLKIVRRQGRSSLHIGASSAAAPMLQHMGEILLERVRTAGVKNIDSVRIIHTGPTAFTAKTAQKQSIIDPEQQKALALSLAGVKNASLRSALMRLGEAALSEPGT